jgi:hypothetical protein
VKPVLRGGFVEVGAGVNLDQDQDLPGRRWGGRDRVVWESGESALEEGKDRLGQEQGQVRKVPWEADFRGEE